jgi:hypothetical protein
LQRGEQQAIEVISMELKPEEYKKDFLIYFENHPRNKSTGFKIEDMRYNKFLKVKGRQTFDSVYGNKEAAMEKAKAYIDHKLEMEARPDVLICSFCGGYLGATETQEHDNPNFAEYKTCLECRYQWAKEYWSWLKKQQMER